MLRIQSAELSEEGPEVMVVPQWLVFPSWKRRSSRSALPAYDPSADFHLRWLHLFWQSSHPFPEKTTFLIIY